MLYYVLQELRGNTYIHGPYKSEQARDRRFDKVRGGEVYKFNSLSSELERVRQEFNDERLDLV